MIQIKISHKDLETIGTGSLTGKLTQLSTESLPLTKIIKEEIQFLFQDSSREWKIKNGPENIVIPEYVIPCIMEDILGLINQHGAKVSVSTYIQDPE